MALSFEFVLALAIIYGTTYAFGVIERYDIPVLVSEILAGIVFGSILGIVGPGMHGYEFIVGLASFGLLLIMFDAGLELDPKPIREDPQTVAVLGVLTFVLPFLAGVALGLAIGLTTFAAFLVGVTISTTSLGLVYPLLDDFDYLGSDTGQLILAVAVLNDILSVIMLAYGITLTSSDPWVGSAIVTGTVLFFFVAVPIFLVDRIRPYVPTDLRANPVKYGIFFAVLLAGLMELLGIHAILGGFFAGLLLAEVTHEGHEIERAMKPVINVVAPIFFFFVGMQFHVRGLSQNALELVVLVVALGIGAKVFGAVVGGVVTEIDRRTTLLLASAMPGRLSISVAAAEIGLTRGLISTPLYDAFIVLSTLSVFVASLSFRHFAND